MGVGLSLAKPGHEFSSPCCDLLRLNEDLLGLEVLSLDGGQNNFPGNWIKLKPVNTDVI